MGNGLWVKQMIEDNERYADPIDSGCARAEEWIAGQIAEHRYQLSKSALTYEQGYCRNCNDKLDDGRAFCDPECAKDFEYRQKMNKHRGKL